MLKTLLALLATVWLFPSTARAVNPFDQFLTNLAQDRLAPFALDVGGLLGAADFHSARTLAFPGFDVGLVGSVQSKPEADDQIMNLAGVKGFGLPMLQASVGLPVIPLNLSVRGLSAGGAKFVGGGLRFGVYKSGLIMAIPDVSVNLNYDVMSHDVFKLGHMSAGVQASFNIPIVKPFVGIGFDRTKVEVNSPLSLLNGVSAKASGTRAQVGATISPLPFVYIYGAYNLLHGQTGYSFGLGAKFGGIL